MITVMAFTRYSSAGASSRVRFYQYIEALRPYGIDIDIRPLVGERYIWRLYRGSGRAFGELVAAYWRRMEDVLATTLAPVVWLEKELFPWLPSRLESRLLRSTRTVVDYDDAVFHTYDNHPHCIVRKLMGRKIDAVMRNAHTVIAGNTYIADRAHLAGATRIEILPSVVDATKYTPRAGTTRSLFVIGWIGSPATQYLLEPYVDIISEVLTGSGGRFQTVGARFDQPLLSGHERLRWSESTEAQDVANFDVGIMPLRDAPFERGKCGYKIVQYMACGLPVIASPVGVNQEIVRHGETGFLASTADEWRKALTTLRDNPDLRRQMGMAGRRNFERKFSLQVTTPRLAEILRRVAKDC